MSMFNSYYDESPSGSESESDKKVRWLPGEKQRLTRLRAKIQAGNYWDDMYTDINPHRLQWVLWLRARGYFSEDC